MVKKRFMCLIALVYTLTTLKSQSYCYAENFVATELTIAPTDSLENDLSVEIPLKSTVKVLFRTMSDYCFVSVGNKFGYMKIGTLVFTEPNCKDSLQFHPYSVANIMGRD